MKFSHKKFQVVVFLLGVFPLIAFAGNVRSDAEIRKQMIQSSISKYQSACPCPYSLKANGQKCGAESTYSQSGGKTFACYGSDISGEMVRLYREELTRHPDDSTLAE